MSSFSSFTTEAITYSVGLLMFRLLVGSFMLTHGWPKLKNFSVYSQKFPSFAGISSSYTLSLTIFAEFFCTCLIMLGLFTRLAAIPLILNMTLATILVHGKEPFAKKEMALIYGTAFLVLLLTGAGVFSIDYLLGLH